MCINDNYVEINDQYPYTKATDDVVPERLDFSLVVAEAL